MANPKSHDSHAATAPPPHEAAPQAQHAAEAAFTLTGKNVVNWAEDRAAKITAEWILYRIPLSLLRQVAAMRGTQELIASGVVSLIASYFIPEGKKYTQAVEQYFTATINDVTSRASAVLAQRLAGLDEAALEPLPELDQAGMGRALAFVMLHPQAEQIFGAINALGSRREAMFWAKLSLLPEEQAQEAIAKLTPAMVETMIPASTTAQAAPPQRDLTAEVMTARGMVGDQGWWPKVKRFFGFWTPKAIPGQVGRVEEAKSFFKEVQRTGMLAYFFVAILPVLIILLGNLLRFQPLIVFGAVVSMFVTLTFLLFAPWPLWFAALVYKPTQDATTSILLKILIPLLYWQSVVGMVAIILPVHLMPFGGLILLIFTVLVLSFGTPLRPAGGSFGFFIEGFYMVAEITFTALVVSLALPDGLEKAVTEGFFGQLLAFLAYAARGFNGYPGIDLGKLFGGFMVLAVVVTAVEIFRRKVLIRMGKAPVSHAAHTVVPVAATHNSPSSHDSGSNGSWFSWRSLAALGAVAFGVYLYDSAGFGRLISVPLLPFMVILTLLFVFFKNFIVRTLAMLAMIFFIVASTRLIAYLPGPWAAQVQKAAQVVVETAEKGVQKGAEVGGELVAKLAPDSSTAATAAPSASLKSIEETIDLSGTRVSVYQKNGGLVGEFVPAGVSVKAGTILTHVGGPDSIFVAQGVFEGSKVVSNWGAKLTAGKAVTVKVAGELYIWNPSELDLKGQVRLKLQ